MAAQAGKRLTARLVLFDGMGHDLPRELWDDIVGALKTTFAEAR